MNQIPIQSLMRRVTIFGWGLVIPVIVLNGYFGRHFSPMVSWVIDDGWCTPPMEGIGKHCFGDFSDIYSRNPGNPWNWIAPMAHPPLPLLIHGLYRDFGEITGQKQFTLFVWLLTIAICLLAPYFYIQRINKWKNAAEDFLILGLGALPVIFVLDRGNNLALSIPVLVLLGWAVSKGKENICVFLIVIATLLRPQLIFLLLIFLPTGNLFMILRSVLWIIRGLLLSFLINPGDRVNNMTSWFERMFEYQSYSNPYEITNNVSFARTASLFIQLVLRTGLDLPSSFKQIPLRMSIGTLLIPILIFTLIFWLRAHRITKEMQFFLVILLSISIPQVSYGYYLAFLMPFLAMLLASGYTTDSFMTILFLRNRMMQKIGTFLFLSATVFTLVPLTIPLSTLIPNREFDGHSLTQGLASATWHLFALYLIFLMLIPDRCFQTNDRVGQLIVSKGTADVKSSA